MSWTTLLVNDNNPIKNLYINNENVAGTSNIANANIITADITNLTVVNPPIIPNVIFDSTDVTLSTGFIMESNGTHEIKQSGVSIASNNLILPATKTITVDNIISNASHDLTIKSATDQNMIIDAQGTGKILINSVGQQQMIIGVNGSGASDDLIIAPAGDITRSSLQPGVYNVGGEDHAYIQALASGVPKPVRIGNVAPVIINDLSTADASFTHALEVQGDVNVRANGGLYMAGSLLSDTSKNLTTGTCQGSSLTYNSLVSNNGVDLTINSANNKNIIMDALGTGKILINSVGQNEMIIGVNGSGASDDLIIAPAGDITRSSLQPGVYNVGGEDHAYIQALASGVPKPVRIGNVAPVIINDLSTADASFTHALEVQGDVNVRANGGLYMAGSLLSDTSKNLTTGTCQGSSLTYNSLVSNNGVDLTINSANNQNMIIDAQGTGKILINSVGQQQMIIGVNSSGGSDALYIAPDGDITRASLQPGVYNVGGEDHAYIQAVGNAALKPVRIGNFAPVIINDVATADVSFVHALEVQGSVNIRSPGSLYCNGVQTLDPSRNATINNLTVAGTRPQNVSSYLNSSVVAPSSLNGIYIAIPSNVSILKEAKFNVSLSGLAGIGGAYVSIYSSTGALIVQSPVVNANGIAQVLTFGSNNSLNSATYLEYRVTWDGGVVSGTFVIASACVTLN